MTRTLVTLLAGTLLAQQALAAGTSMIPPTDEDLRAIPRIAGERRAPFEAARSPLARLQRATGAASFFVSRGMPRPELVAAIAAARADPQPHPGRARRPARRDPGRRHGAWAALLGRTATPPALLIDPRLFRRYAVAPCRPWSTPQRRAAARHRQPEPAGAGAPAAGRPRSRADRPHLANRRARSCLVLRSRAERLDLPAVPRPPSPGSGARCRPSPCRRPRPAACAASARWRGPARHSGTTGRLLLPARSELNPLEQVPLTARILVIDAQDPRELAWAKTQRAANRATIHLVANPDRAGGWPAWQTLQNGLEAPAFLLDRHLAGPAGVRATPSLIEADGAGARRHEIALPRTILEHDR